MGIREFLTTYAGDFMVRIYDEKENCKKIYEGNLVGAIQLFGKFPVKQWHTKDKTISIVSVTEL